MSASSPRVVHLAKRFVGMMSRRPIADEDLRWVSSVLLDGESELWHALPVADRRHSLLVAERLVEALNRACSEATRDEIAAALLHDVGKTASDLGIIERVVATLVGPRTRRFRLYHAHEQIGAEILAAAGSSARTISLIDGTSPDRRVVEALRRADDI